MMISLTGPVRVGQIWDDNNEKQQLIQSIKRKLRNG
jgi:hypothetical protein